MTHHLIQQARNRKCAGFVAVHQFDAVGTDDVAIATGGFEDAMAKNEKKAFLLF